MSTQATELPVESAERIRELMLANLFAVFSERDPERRLEVRNRPWVRLQTASCGRAASCS